MDDTPSVGYLIKAVQSLLRQRMEEALRPQNLSVSHYSCLFRLREEPGVSASELARATFMTRQSMNELLQTLVDRGLVERAAVAPSGRALPASLTPAGRAELQLAQAAVDAVEQSMLSRLDRAEASALAASLAACATALAEPGTENR